MPYVQSDDAVWADAGALLDWAAQTLHMAIQIVKRTEAHRFVVLPRRWVVERTLAWPLGCRRLQVRYERRADLLEGLLHLAWALICLRFVDPRSAP